tara:strand:+ start:97 stop:597 length:501 start_codon:yes stop_codon:yes gene_type:complete
VTAQGFHTDVTPTINEYLSSIHIIERLHRQFLEVVKLELERLGLMDINNIQALILYNIAQEELTVGELTNRGYYLGSNVSYNVRKMVENGYLDQQRSKHDKRSVRVKLSDKGLTLWRAIEDMFNRHAASMGPDNVTEEDLRTANEILARLERFWGGSHRFGGGSLF